MRGEPPLLVKALLYVLVAAVMLFVCVALFAGCAEIFGSADEPCTAHKPVEECIF